MPPFYLFLQPPLHNSSLQITFATPFHDSSSQLTFATPFRNSSSRLTFATPFRDSISQPPFATHCFVTNPLCDSTTDGRTVSKTPASSP